MAVIGSIRKQSGLMIILVGAAMALFILSDLTGSGSGGFSSEDVVLGEIRDHEVTQREFELMVEERISEQYGPEGAPETAKDAIRQRVWQQMLQEHILFEEYEKLGISVSADELLDQVQNTQPGSVLYQYFTNPQTGQVLEQFRDPSTGLLNSQAVLGAIQQLLNSESAADWLPIEKAIKQDRMFSKYMTLVTKGLTATGNEAQQQFNEKSEKRSFQYALREFSSIADEEITVSDSDLQKYYNEHKNEKRFQQPEEIRSLEYVVFEVTPSDQDIRDIYGELGNLIPFFAADSNDTAFVAENADTPVQSAIRLVKAKQLPALIKDTIVNSDTGAVFGPYEQGTSIVITKLTGISFSPDSVRARHILLKPNPADSGAISAARAKLDSLKSVIETKKNFAAMATEYSEDLGTGALGGDLNWMTRGSQAPRLEQAAFNAKVGEMMVVTTQLGIHLIEVTERTKDIKRYTIANVDRLKEASKNTTDEVYRIASAFAIENNTLDKFKAKGESLNIQSAPSVRITDDAVGPISEAREAVRWAYDNEKGSISDPMELGNAFVVAALTNVRPKGVLPLDAAKTDITAEVIKQKKAERIKSDLGNYTDINAAAKALNSEVMPAQDVYFNSASMPGGLGREMSVLGAAFALKQGAVSKPIVGNRGVFVIQVTSIEPAPADADLATEKSQMTLERESRAQRAVYQALQEEAKIEDNRGRYY